MALHNMLPYYNTLRYAKNADKKDPLRKYRREFILPKQKGKPIIYFTGHSLGLQNKIAKKCVDHEMNKWGKIAVQGHFEKPSPWLHYHKRTKKMLAKIVGAKPSEVIAMNQLTVNLHLMMVSFYRPTKQRFKIIIENKAFPSDQYAIASHIKHHNIAPRQALITVKPRLASYCLHNEDIAQTIEQHHDQIALVLLGGVQYYTGQFFDIASITKMGQKAGALVGFDLAHAVGNVPLSLHNDHVDFAVWCGYKYLNGGPGGMAGSFIHEKHHKSKTMHRFAGWWGHNEKKRFLMENTFEPMSGADGWQLSNVPILSAATHWAALSTIDKVGMTAIRKKSILLTGYLYFLLDAINDEGKYFTIITPQNKKERGCQISLLMKKQQGKKIFDLLLHHRVIVDWREPSSIRMAPNPLYNTYEEVYQVASILQKILHKKI